MQSLWLGRIPFEAALDHQSRVLTRLLQGGEGAILGFESEPVITLGLRSTREDLLFPPGSIRARGYATLQLDRGGQATLHNPGQLVIFPVMPIGPHGVKAWIERLAETTRRSAGHFDKNIEWNPACPGLYSTGGKVASIGVRVRQGLSTHGVSVNVTNDLSAFGLIRACGVQGASVDQLGEPVTPEALFAVWLDKFHQGDIDNPAVFAEFKDRLDTDVRS